MGESATLRVARRADELKRSGVSIIDFGAGEPDFDSPAAAVERARQALADGFTRYTQGSGMPELREALAESYRRRHGAPWEMADVVVTVGAKAALFELALALYEPGQEVVVPSPCWVSFPEQIRFAGAEVVPVPMSHEDGFRIHAEPLLEAVTERTRAILVNSPSNPTGGVLGAEDLERLVRFSAERGIVLVADETYERFVYGEAPRVSAASWAGEFPDTVVVISSFSKTWAMTGWRLGWIAGPPAIIRAVAAIQSHATSNATSFAMAGAVAALEEAEADVEAMIAEYEARRDLVVPRLNALPGITCRPPAGAFYAFPRVADTYGDGVGDSIRWSEWMLDEAGVALVPGAAFGDDAHVRLSFACSRRELEEGLDRMAVLLERGTAAKAVG